MCLVLPAQVVSVDADRAEVRLADGTCTWVSRELHPEVTGGDYVLVDRGLIIGSLAATEAEAILSMYAEIGGLLEVEDAGA